MADAFDMPGGPAFPISIPGVGDNGCPGMSLRDYFAAKALPVALDRIGAGRLTDQCVINMSVEVAYRVADAMLAERQKPRAAR